MRFPLGCALGWAKGTMYSPDPILEGAILRGEEGPIAKYREYHFMCGGDTAFCQITWTTYLLDRIAVLRT